MLNNLRQQATRTGLKSNLMRNVVKFNFAQNAMPTLEGKPTDHKQLSGGETRAVQPWVEVENRLARLRGELVLSDHGKIESYVMGVVKGYFRTTYRDGLTLESKLEDHGLDSLDAIEIGMILEDDLC